MKIHHHLYDLPMDYVPGACVAIDTEAMGLVYHRDRLCLVQLTNDANDVYLIQFPTADFSKSPRLRALLEDASIIKLFHFARFDVAILQHSFQLTMANIYCTKIASRLTRTFTGKHGLKDLCKDLLKVELEKEEQTSDWGAKELSQSQKRYAATDVIHLHALKNALDQLLSRESRADIAAACFQFLPTRAKLDCLAGETLDIFSHS